MKRSDSKKIFTESGIEIKPVYSLHNTKAENPGEFPFTRGTTADMYRGKLWTMRQYAGFSTAEESNKRYKYLLGQGTTGLSVAFDLPTQIGYDSDHELSEGEVGKAGVAIDSLRDMEVLFDGIPLDGITTSMTINSTASILLALYIALAKKQGADLKKISGTIQNDLLKEYAARGTYIYPPKASMRIITDIFEFCGRPYDRYVREPVGNNYLEIITLEGVMKAQPGDYIIKGVKGEFYPCKPDIFEKTYELVEEC